MMIIDFLAFAYYNIRMSKYIHSRTCVYNVNYHIVWCVKYRRKVLSAPIADRLRDIIWEFCLVEHMLCKAYKNKHEAPPSLLERRCIFGLVGNFQKQVPGDEPLCGSLKLACHTLNSLLQLGMSRTKFSPQFIDV